MNAVSYLRVSGHGQVEGDGFPRQRAAIERYAASNGYNLVGEYHEDISGTKDGAEREAFATMLAEISLEGTSVILIERADRFARSMEAAISTLALCMKEGIQVIGADTGMELTESDDPMLKAFIRMQFVFAELERGMIEKKLRAARQRARQLKGRCEGAKPYGFYTNEKITKALIITLAKRSVGPAEISRELNNRGLKTRSGKPWNRGTVHKILKNGKVEA